MPPISLAASSPARDFIRVFTEETIAAQSTAPGEAAIAIIRISGREAVAVGRRILAIRGVQPFDAPRRLCRGRVLLRGEPVDDVLAVFFAGPSSYTGEDVLEIHGHGGVLVAARVLEAALEAGARPATPGEFTRRAFLNGRMDLTQAEAVMDIIRARTPLALAAAQEQLEGGLGREMAALRERLLALVANIEAWIDFPEEGIDPQTGDAFLSSVRAVESGIAELLRTAHDGRIFREGIRLVLCGRPNAGKSSLLNRLLRYERAIVDPAPGTTRDTIEESANLGGWPFQIIDTAGLRETGDRVEHLGVERSLSAMRSADVILRVMDATEGIPSLPNDPRELIAWNKIDLLTAEPGKLPDRVLPVSCRTGVGLPELTGALVGAARGTPSGRPTAFVINTRHKACLERARAALRRAAVELAAGQAPELAASELHTALEAVGEVLGAADTEEILGEIFSRFCIGK